MIQEARIASVHFWPLTQLRNYRAAPYFLDAAQSDDVTYLHIESLIESQDGAYNGQNTRSKFREPVFAHHIAQDLVREWTQTGIYMSPGVNPGVWMVREYEQEMLPSTYAPDGSVIPGNPRMGINGPMYRRASDAQIAEWFKEDMAAARLADRAYAEVLMTKAIAITNDPARHAGTSVSKMMKAATARYVPESQWPRYMHQVTIASTKACSFCTKQVPSFAIKCPECQEIIDPVEYYKKRTEAELARLEYEALIAPSAKTAPVTKPS